MPAASASTAMMGARTLKADVNADKPVMISQALNNRKPIFLVICIIVSLFLMKLCWLASKGYDWRCDLFWQFQDFLAAFLYFLSTYRPIPNYCEISLTTSAVFFGWSRRMATSACAIMPTILFSLSTTGIRRNWCSTIASRATWRSSSA